MIEEFTLNVTQEHGTEVIPCFLCHHPVDVRTDKRQKPYFICEGCGVQCFVRRKVGKELLHDLVGKIHAGTSEGLETIALLDQLMELKAKKEQFERSVSELFTPDPELETVRTAIHAEIEKIKVQIQVINQRQK